MPAELRKGLPKGLALGVIRPDFDQAIPIWECLKIIERLHPHIRQSPYLRPTAQLDIVTILDLSTHR